MMDSIERRRAELHLWIADTQRTQRQLGKLLAALGAISVGLMFARPTVGFFGIVVTAIVGFMGFWITASHIADWRSKLDDLRRRQAG